MAEVLLSHLVASDADLNGHVIVTSAGTANWHVGEEMDPRARAALDRAGLLGEGSPAAYADHAYLDAQDLIIVMTGEHLVDVRERLRGETEVRTWRSFHESPSTLDVVDPFYGGPAEFDACLATLRAAGPRLTSELRQRLGARWDEV
jgi:protein-tyrosine phosphatase